jgi:hypothetical protein
MADRDTPDAGYQVEQGHQLGDIVAVSAGQRDGQRGAVPVSDQVVLAARTRAVDRRRSGVSPRGCYVVSSRLSEFVDAAARLLAGAFEELEGLAADRPE